MKINRTAEATASNYEDAFNSALEKLGLEKDEVKEISKKESGIIRKKVTVVLEENLSPIKKVKKFLDGIIERLGIDCTATVEDTDDCYNISISGPDTSVLIGYRGDVLDSLQYLSLLIVNKEDKSDNKRLVINGENFREKREVTLNKLAKKLAFQASKSKTEVKLEPMNPFERRIIHSALTNDKYVTTSSEGVEPNRYVVIKPVKRTYDNKDRKPYNKDRKFDKPQNTQEKIDKRLESKTQESSLSNISKSGIKKFKSFGGEKRKFF